MRWNFFEIGNFDFGFGLENIFLIVFREKQIKRMNLSSIKLPKVDWEILLYFEDVLLPRVFLPEGVLSNKIKYQLDGILIWTSRKISTNILIPLTLHFPIEKFFKIKFDWSFQENWIFIRAFNRILLKNP